MSDVISKPILENVTSDVQIPEDLVSFDDCPNHCNKGKIFDPYKHKTTICPYCAEKRKTLLKQAVVDKDSKENLLQRLGLKPNLFGTSFDFNNIIPEGDRPNIEDTSYLNTRDSVDALMNKATLGEDIEFSLFYSFGVRANILNFVYPLLVRYYKAGVEVAPFMQAREVSKLRYYDSICDDTKIKGVTYADLLKKKLCVVWLDAGCCLKDIDTVKGLMECRALNDFVTIIVSSTLDINMLRLQIADEIEQCKHLATPYYIKYTQKHTKEQSNMATNLTTDYSERHGAYKSNSVIESNKRMNNTGGLSEDAFAALVGK